MKRASYREGIEYVALNDEPTCGSECEMVGMPTVGLMAALFGIDTERVAKDVVRFRRKVWAEEDRESRRAIKHADAVARDNDSTQGGAR